MNTALCLDQFDAKLPTNAAKDFLRFREGRCSWSQFDQAYRVSASRLAAAGIATGDLVPTFFGNTQTAVEIWFALMQLGTVWAPINTEFRGEQLVNALNLMESPRLVVDAPYLAQIIEVLPRLEHLETIILRGAGKLPASSGVELIDYDALPGDGKLVRFPVDPADIAVIQFTSGSTGVSKAVQLSHGYLATQSRMLVDCAGLLSDDVLYCPYPLYHWDATVGTVLAALVAGGTAALAPRFSVSRFWTDIHEFGATVFDFMGATLTFIYRQPEQAEDGNNPVRLAWGVPMPEFKDDFERRFDLQLIEGYGSTEGGVMVYQRPGEAFPPGSCGRVHPLYQLKIVDDQRRELAAGEVGEIVTKPQDPTSMFSGYFKMPEVNAELIRDGWYHSGDLGRLDERGNLYFAGRKKDVIRRRGENMSALEIEQVIGKHPAISEVAAYGVPSEYSEEEVAVAVVLRAGASLDETQLRAFCQGKMATYMIPEHILFLERLPKTPTEKVAKTELKQRHQALLQLN